MNKIGIHVSLWTPEWTDPFLGHIEKAAKLGFGAVEIPIMDPESFPVAEVKDVLDRTGLEVYCGTGLGPGTNAASLDASVREASKKHLLACIGIAGKLGAPGIQGVIHSAWGWQEPVGEANRQASAGVLAEVAKAAGEQGMGLGLECINRYESSFLNTVKQGIHMLELIGEENVGLHLDSYHMNIEENSIAEAILLAGKRLRHFHLSENQRGFPGSGNLDWEEIVQAVKAAGYSGPWMIESYIFPEYPAGKDVSIWRDIEEAPESSLKRSLKMLNTLIQAK